MTSTNQGRGGDGLYRKRNIWYFRVVDWTGKRRSISTKTRVYSEALTKRREHLEAIKQGAAPAGSGHLLMKDAAQRWLDRRLLDAVYETAKAYKNRVKQITAILGALPIGSINADTLRRYQIERRSAGMAPASVNAETRAIAGIMKENKLWIRLREDFHKLREPETGGRRVTEDEMERLLKVADTRRDVSVIFLVMRLMIETGMRHKEVRMLKCESIDLDRNSIVIERVATKTNSGVRVIPMTALARVIASDLLDRASEMGATKPAHCLFPGIEFKKQDGKLRRIPNPLVPQLSFGGAWRTLRRLAGVDKTLRIHDLRHHMATDLAEAGVPSAVAMRLMGWSSTEMRKRYEHVQDSSLRRGMDTLTAHRAIVAPRPEPESRQSNVIPFARARAR
jgi:integrase